MGFVVWKLGCVLRVFQVNKVKAPGRAVCAETRACGVRFDCGLLEFYAGIRVG